MISGPERGMRAAIRGLPWRPVAAGFAAGWATLLAALLVLQVSRIPDWIVRPLQRSDTSGEADAVVVLGAGYWEPCGLNLSGLRRTEWGVKSWRAGRAPVLLFSGGSTQTSGGVPVSHRMAERAREMGVPAEAIVVEDRSRSTWENARFSAEILRARGARRILLVTDSIHMGRADACFRRVGFVPERASVPQTCASVDNIAMLRGALHEYGAWLAYVLRGDLAPL